jgi:hypothetical protein
VELEMWSCKLPCTFAKVMQRSLRVLFQGTITNWPPRSLFFMHKYVGPVEGRTYIASKFLLSTRQALCFLRLTLVTHAHVLGVRVYPLYPGSTRETSYAKTGPPKNSMLRRYGNHISPQAAAQRYDLGIRSTNLSTPEHLSQRYRQHR